MTDQTIKIMLVEDAEADADILGIELRNAKVSHQLLRVQRLSDAISQVEKAPFDVIFLDVNLPDSRGIETIEKFCAAATKSATNSHTPVIVMTGLDDYAFSRKAMTLNVKDYLVKGEFETDDLRRAISFATLKRALPNRRWFGY